MDLLWIVIIAGYGVCTVQSIYGLTAKRRVMPRAGLLALWVALGAHTVWLVLRGIRTGRCPLVGTEEMTAFLSWGLVVAALIANRWYRADALKAFIFPLVLVLATIAAIAPGTEGRPAGLDNPLQRILFPVHAGLILLAYSAFFVAFGAGLMYLIQERELKNKRLGKFSDRLPSLKTCDSISIKSLTFGFILLTLGIAAGIGWQRARDGQYWHGDPIEIFAYFTWFIYLLLIQSRMNAGWRGRTAALASILSFMIVIFSLVGVRFLGSLHSTG
jgi:cytochrome c-type biogenesis protein CcsB